MPTLESASGADWRKFFGPTAGIVIAAVLAFGVTRYVAEPIGSAPSAACSAPICDLGMVDLTAAPGELPAAVSVEAQFAAAITASWRLGAGPGRLKLPAHDDFYYVLVGACLGGGKMTVEAAAANGTIAELAIGCNGHMGPGLGFPGSYKDTAGVLHQLGSGPFEVTVRMDGNVTQAEYFVLRSTT